MALDNVRRIDDGYVRDTGELLSGGNPHCVHLASRDDHTEVYPHWLSGNYSSACSWCYLGASHSFSAHRKAVSGEYR